MRRPVTALLSALLLLLTTLTTLTTVTTGARAAHDPDSRRINASITPPGGIKAAQTGGNTVGDVIREERPRADGYRHIDTPATIRVLSRLGVNTYVYLIWNSPTDWQDLVEEFAPAAQKAGIRLWLYLVPPSECQTNPVKHLNGRCSRPFEKDYVKWAEEIAKLSIARPNVAAWALDDFFSQLPPGEIEEMQRVQDAINPDLGFYTTVYYGEAVNPHFYDRYQGVIDGIIYPYTGANSNTQDASRIRPNLEAILALTEPRGLGVVLLAYTGRYLSAIVPPTDRYIADVITETRPFMRSGRLMGITLYGLPIADGKAMTSYNVARTGSGWLSLAPSIFARTEPGDYAEAAQPITVDPGATAMSLDFSDFDLYYDQNNTASRYHTRQILVDGQVVWEADAPASGGVWYRHHVDLSAALKGKRQATLAIRLTDKTSLSLWTGIVVDDLRATGFRLSDGGFERDGAWKLTRNNDAIFAEVHHFTDFDPSNALEAARTAFRGEPYRQSPARGPNRPGEAMYGTGRLRLAVEAFTRTPAGACAKAEQTLNVDPASPRYEIDFFQTSPHTPYPGYAGAHMLNAKIDGQPVWARDANSVYPFWENGNSLQGPVDVSDFVQGKSSVTLSFELCGLQHNDTRPNPPIDIGFDNLRTVGLTGRDFGFEGGDAWRFSSTSPALSARVVRPSARPEAPALAVRAGQVVARAGTVAKVPVTLANSGATPLGGDLTAALPEGWTADPATTPFGPIPAGGSAQAVINVTIPAGAAEGTYWLTVAAGEARSATRAQVIGDKVEFTPGTAGEAFWLVEPDGSQLDGTIFDGRGRFADGSTSFVYRFDVPADVTGGSLTLHVGNEFVVKVSGDGQQWREIARETREIHNLSNLADRTFDLNEVRQAGQPLFVRIEDAKIDDGWGGWLGRLKLVMTR
ncbi:NEW3 domain-containing protein [Nonomuraea sp. NBC_01738]|uniref:NEW3 domain-containing protein n=1 Tax=Nonomuraea sp. NBC_01738 TaxID=2976003 RepID=UPI002E13926F|nr:NEW3 domain-containing protein [Nonomuraea sp. NBC_01738]